jgi:hypothetical protein
MKIYFIKDDLSNESIASMCVVFGWALQTLGSKGSLEPITHIYVIDPTTSTTSSMLRQLLADMHANDLIITNTEPDCFTKKLDVHNRVMALFPKKGAVGTAVWPSMIMNAVKINVPILLMPDDVLGARATTLGINLKNASTTPDPRTMPLVNALFTPKAQMAALLDMRAIHSYFLRMLTYTMSLLPSNELELPLLLYLGAGKTYDANEVLRKGAEVPGDGN